MSHKAIVRHGDVCAVESRPTPTAGPGEIVVAPEQVSLCGTDIQILRRVRDDPSDVVGHEGAARVVEVGEGVAGFAPGDRVVVNPTHPGDPSFLLGHNVGGLFQQRVLIAASAVSGGLVGRLPEELSSARATLVEPYAVVRYAMACLAKVAPRSFVVFGDGLIGNLAAFVARRWLHPEVDVVVVHRTELGHAWTSKALPDVRNVRWDEVDRLALAVGPVAVLVATHRDGTVP
ncbi:MAG TPA: alcohol dehydrogenase catalytic domain-containing protein, partial [Lentzea sp.]